MSYTRAQFDDKANLEAAMIDTCLSSIDSVFNLLLTSREKNIAITKLDEFRMWAMAAIAYDTQERRLSK